MTYRKWAQNFDIAPLAGSAGDESHRTATQPDLDYLRKRLGRDGIIGRPTATRMPGIYQIRFGDQTLYLSADGEFAFIGDMIDLKNGINLSKRNVK